MPEPIIELKSVRKTLTSKTDGIEVLTSVFDCLDLTVSVGERVGVIGPSGSGKTTLLKLINRLEDADEGAVVIGGRDVLNWDVQSLRRKAALVLQKPYIFEGSVYDNVAFPYKAANEKAPSHETVERLLSEAGLTDIDTARPAAALSVGQQQRVCLARSLATNPVVLMLDETTSSLDPSVAAGVLKKIYERCRIEGLTLIHVTHEVPKLRGLDRLVVIADGTITEEGTPERILEGPISGVTRDFLAGFN